MLHKDRARQAGQGPINLATVGPGLWYSLHKEAAHADTRTKRRRLLKRMQDWSASLDCPTCRHHLGEFLRRTKHLWPDIIFGGPEIALYYTWFLHDDVNRRKGLTAGARPSFEEIKAIYMKKTAGGPEKTCDTFCTDAE